jgi:hypothetical protein
MYSPWKRHGVLLITRILPIGTILTARAVLSLDWLHGDCTI